MEKKLQILLIGSRQGLKNIVNKLDRAESDENEIIFVTLTYGSDTEKLR
jgi:hypothetical protein